MLRKFHLVVGLVGVIVFLLTGQYMQWFLGHLQGMADGPRMIFRAAHIYLLWASLLNLLLGCYLPHTPGGFARLMHVGGSLILLASPVLLCWSFFYEPYNAELWRPVGYWTIIVVLLGTLMHALATLLTRKKR